MIKLLHPPVLRKLNVCAYARISSDKDVNELSLDEQIEVYTNMILNNNNWNFCGIYFDDGISGASTKGRTSFNLMIEKAMLGQIDVIIVKSISRFARNTIDLLKTIQDLRNIDVEVFFENENFSSLDFKCDMLLTCYAKFAEEEVISMSLNRSWRHQVDREAGRYFLPSRKLYGLRQKTTGEIYIYEPEAKWIRVIYDMYLQDKSMGEIIAVLTENKVPTYTGHGEWRATVIRSMLKNEKYVGDCLMQKTYTKNPLIHKSDNNYGERPMYYIKDGHPAIISREKWDKVQEKLATARKKFKIKTAVEFPEVYENMNRSYSKFLYCPYCKNHYYLRTITHAGKEPTKTLNCSSNKNTNRCKNESVFVEVLNKIIAKLLITLQKERKAFRKALFETYKQEPDERTIEALKALQSQIKGLTERYREIPPTSEYNNELRTSILEELTKVTQEKNFIEMTIPTEEAIDRQVNEIMEILDSCPVEVTSIDSSSYRKLFKKVIVYNRNKLVFIIGNDDISKLPKKINPQFQTSIEYKIRKTTFTCKFGIYINK